MSDPKPEEYEEICQVEIEEEVCGECQIPLGMLFPIVKKSGEIIYNSQTFDLVGEDEDGELSVILIDNEEKVVYSEDIEEKRHICDLSFEELVQLRGEICAGSMYYSDYNNSLGVDRKEVLDWTDGYLEDLELSGDTDTPENFAEYCLSAG